MRPSRLQFVWIPTIEATGWKIGSNAAAQSAQPQPCHALAEEPVELGGQAAEAELLAD